MPRPTTARPIEPTRPPQPEEFGLTQGRVSRFQNSPPKAVPLLLATPFALLIVAKILILSGGSLLWLLLPFTWYYPILFTVAAFGGIYRLIDAAWLRRQPDSETYQRYTQALKLHALSLKVYREQLDSWERTQLEWWRKLNGRCFERELAKLLRTKGYTVELTPATNDGGVDLILRRGAQSILVQCKAHRNPVGPGPVRDLFGTFTHRGGTAAWLVSTSSFTKGASAFASGKPIRLVSISELVNDWPGA